MKRCLFPIFALASVTAAFAADTPIAVLNSPVGRYVFGEISAQHADVYMLDAQTGRLWQITCFDQPAPAAGALCQDRRLVPIPYFIPPSPAAYEPPASELRTPPAPNPKK